MLGVVMKRRKLLFDAGWIQLFQASATIREREVDWVFCSRKRIENPSQPDAVVLVPFVRDGDETKLLVIKEYRIPLGGFEYGLPAGLVDPDESADVAMGRELIEATGYRVDRVLSKSPKFLYSSAGLTDESFQYCFVAASPGPGQQLEATESIEVGLYSVAELAALFESDVMLSSRLWAIGHGYIEAGQYPDLKPACGREP